jgi:TRAP-type C4-dicarboxylate transport system permease small subunit
VSAAPAPGAAGAGDGPAAAVPATAYGSPLPFGLHRLMRAMNALGTLWIAALMVLINVDVIGRNLFASPLPGVPEMVALSIVGIVFLQLADTLREGRFTRADILLDRLALSAPRAHDALHALFHTVGAALMLVILWASWEPLAESVRIREYVGAIGAFQAPVWPVRLITLAGLGATTLCYALLAFADLRRLAGRARGGSR